MFLDMMREGNEKLRLERKAGRALKASVSSFAFILVSMKRH